jgi:DNA-binding MarR family transcriptional regulator
VDGLVRQGLLERTEAEHDRRAKLLALTAKGRALIEKGIAKRGEWMEGLTQHLDSERREAIIGALKHLTEAAHKLDMEVELEGPHTGPHRQQS